MRESTVSNLIRLAAAQAGIELYRNNNGVCEDNTGRVIRYGLCNDSAQLSKRIKSSDFIGITPTLVTPDMVGQVAGIFTAIETKTEGWHLTAGDERGQAQAAFHEIVRRAGGYAGFATCVDDFMRIIKRR